MTAFKRACALQLHLDQTKAKFMSRHIGLTFLDVSALRSPETSAGHLDKSSHSGAAVKQNSKETERLAIHFSLRSCDHRKEHLDLLYLLSEAGGLPVRLLYLSIGLESDKRKAGAGDWGIV